MFVFLCFDFLFSPPFLHASLLMCERTSKVCVCVCVRVDLHQEQVWREEHVWTGWHLQHGGCCGTLRFHGNGPPGSSRKWQRCRLGYEMSSTALAPEEEWDKRKGSTPCSWAQTRTVHIYTIIFFTWKMAYMMQLRGLLLENSATLNMLKLHLSRSSSSCFNTQSKASHSLKITLFQKCFIKTFRWSY